MRGRGLSRSSSVPITQRNHNCVETTTNESTAGSKGAGSGSVRHLTCFWWKEKGHCRYGDEQCLYAHYDTGKYADPPRQLIPGQPAMAGRNLDRQLNSLKRLTGSSHRSSPSLTSLGRSGSRPSTPNRQAFDSSIRALTPSPQPQQERSPLDHTLLRNLLNQSIEEKAVMITAIQRLEAENIELKARTEALEQDHGQLTEQCEAYANTILQMRYENGQQNNRFGAIGSQRNGSTNTPQEQRNTSYSDYGNRRYSPPEASPESRNTKFHDYPATYGRGL